MELEDLNGGGEVRSEVLEEGGGEGEVVAMAEVGLRSAGLEGGFEGVGVGLTSAKDLSGRRSSLVGRGE